MDLGKSEVPISAFIGLIRSRVGQRIRVSGPFSISKIRNRDCALLIPFPRSKPNYQVGPLTSAELSKPPLTPSDHGQPTVSSIKSSNPGVRSNASGRNPGTRGTTTRISQLGAQDPTKEQSTTETTHRVNRLTGKGLRVSPTPPGGVTARQGLSGAQPLSPESNNKQTT